MGLRDPRPLDFTAYLRNSGYHESAWRLSGADPAAVVGLDWYVALAAIAERGALDAIFLPDSPGEAEFRSEFLPRSSLDPVQLLSAVAARTERVGLIATASTTYSEPWDLARRIASLDHLSAGRAGWNIVTTVEPAAAANFGADPHPLRETRYERAAEFVAVVLALWDGWEDGAAVLDRERGMWADPARLHPPLARARPRGVRGFDAARARRSPATARALSRPTPPGVFERVGRPHAAQPAQSADGGRAGALYAPPS